LENAPCGKTDRQTDRRTDRNFHYVNSLHAKNVSTFVDPDKGSYGFHTAGSKMEPVR